VPLRNNQFQRLDWGTEVLYSDSRYLCSGARTRPSPGLARSLGDDYDGNVGSVGLYSYVTYKWHRQWSAGFLFDYVQSAEPQRRDLRVFALHHLGPEPLEPNPFAIHAHGPQRGLRPAPGRRHLPAMGVDHRLPLARLASNAKPWFVKKSVN
jgi:hypothetical protein